MRLEQQAGVLATMAGQLFANNFMFKPFSSRQKTKKAGKAYIDLVSANKICTSLLAYCLGVTEVFAYEISDGITLFILESH